MLKRTRCFFHVVLAVPAEFGVRESKKKFNTQNEE
jgi:hypothetical protein